MVSRFRLNDKVQIRIEFRALRSYFKGVMRFVKTTAVAAVCAAFMAVNVSAATEEGFTSLFNGKDLTGWKLMSGVGPGYVVQDGVIVCPADGGGNLMTEKEFSNFILRFDVKLTAAGNNGIGIRAPLEGHAAADGMEIQVLDNEHKSYMNLNPWQYHGSVYGFFPAKRGYQKALGEWNEEEIIADGRHIKVTLNGEVILDENLNTYNSNHQKMLNQCGMLRDTGHIGFLGHGTHVEFRNIRVKELPYPQIDNVAPEGFTALFNGKDLDGWHGTGWTPLSRASMTNEERQNEQTEADKRMRKHWSVQDGVLCYDGLGRIRDNLRTEKEYVNFELLVDWKIDHLGDSGIYLRGTPEVQIWDPSMANVGSGGLINNKKNASDPLVKADKPIGEWNNFRILLLDDKVSVYLNNQLVVRNVTLENFWNPNVPLYPTGFVELQTYGTPVYFKNIYIREIK